MQTNEESAPAKSVVRIAAAADLHCTKTSVGQLAPLLARMAEGADILLLCGDLTDFGSPEEAQILVRELNSVKVPIVGVLGNHDFEMGLQDEVRKILTDAGLRILDGDACEIKGVGFAGVKGFAGGFGRATLGAWGEDIIKRFVQEAMNETMKLEAALSASADAAAHRRTALFPDPNNRGGRTTGDLRFPRLRPPGRAVATL